MSFQNSICRGKISRRQNMNNFPVGRVLSKPRKTIEGYQNYFEFITFEKIISKQSIFVFDRPDTLLFNKMQMKLAGCLLQYNATPNVTTLFIERPHTIKLAFTFFAATLTWSLLILSFRPQISFHTQIQSLHLTAQYFLQ